MKITINEDHCKGCGFCIEICPQHIFTDSPNSNKKGYIVPEIKNSDACTFCKKCELICPEMAILVKKEEK